MSKLEMAQLERLREIGIYLSDVRQDQSLTLEEIASHTYIPLRILRAIESGDDRVLPEPVFVQGFIRRYADAMGLDGKAIAQEFPIYVQPLQSDCIDEEPLVNKPAPWQFPSLKFFKSSPTNPTNQTPNWPLIAAVAIGVLAVGGLLYGVIRSVSQPDGSSQSTSRAEEPAPSPTRAPAASPKQKSTPVAAQSSAPTALFAKSVGPSLAAPGTALVSTITEKTSAPVQVDVSLSRRSWMEVTIDGKSDFEGIMEEGTEQTWLGQNEIKILAGDAGAVSISTNGGEAILMGEDGGIKEVTVTPETKSANGQ